MKQYHVTGMSCAACQARVEQAVSKVAGVTSCTVSLLTGSMGVEGSAAEDAVIAAVKAAGYGAAVSANPAAQILHDHTTDKLKRRLLFSIGFLLILLYFSMGQMLLHLPLPTVLGNRPALLGIIQLLLTTVILVINRQFFISGCKGLLHRAPNMDTLVALGSSASYFWSIYALIRMCIAQSRDGTAAAMPWMREFYFESAAMIVTLITVGKLLESRSKGKTTNALRSLMQLAPQTAAVIRNGAEQVIPATEIQKDDVFLVKPGESIPADGIVLEGSTAVNESALTGESIPVDKTVNSMVSAATVNQSGFLKCKATRVGEDTTLSQIIRMVSDAAATKAPIAKIADRVSGIFVPAVMGISAVTLIIWLLMGKTASFALTRAISVLVISCPCALGLATPVAIMVANGVGAKHGILFKTAVSLEEAGKTQMIVLDKTGTITSGEPQVTKLLPAEGITETDLLRTALTLESKSEHPLAFAIVNEAKQRGIEAEDVTDFRAMAGNGLTAMQNGNLLCGGSFRYIAKQTSLSDPWKQEIQNLADTGNTPLLFTQNSQLLGIIAVADSIKPESPAAIRELQQMGLPVIMLTGDNIRTANAVSKQAGVEFVAAGVLPDGKETVIRKLQTLGKVTMVGDGINDAPALTRADIGIAIGAGTDVAIDAADIVLMNSKLSDIPAAIRLSRATLRNIRENLFWAFFYNIIGIPLAAGCLIGLLGWQMNPIFGAVAMSLSSFCVVSNALRLNLFQLYSPKRDRKTAKPIAADTLRTLLEEISTEKEETSMTKTMNIEGMMCGHCEAHVRKALEAINGVVSAEVSHTNGTAIVTLSQEIAEDTLKSAVEDAGYTVTAIA